VLYSVSMVVLMTAVGAAFFHETPNRWEILGLLMAIGSLVLLVRFA
jgi:drug/metabolite transporter (DMT)-like permease